MDRGARYAAMALSAAAGLMNLSSSTPPVLIIAIRQYRQNDGRTGEAAGQITSPTVRKKGEPKPALSL
jgi:hypothetical protein